VLVAAMCDVKRELLRLSDVGGQDHDHECHYKKKEKKKKRKKGDFSLNAYEIKSALR
jgi:hypothetical protein